MSLNKASWWLRLGVPELRGDALWSSVQQFYSGPNKCLKEIDKFPLFSSGFGEQRFVKMHCLTSQTKCIQKDDN